jgi:hypothetical protein
MKNSLNRMKVLLGWLSLISNSIDEKQDAKQSQKQQQQFYYCGATM